MKRYLLFAGEQYYPDGGWHDFIGSYETVQQAQGKARADGYDWWHIVDTEIWRIVEEEQ